MTGHELRSALTSGQMAYGTAMISQSISWPGFLASTGLDFVFIDTEHTPLDREQVGATCHLYKKSGLAPVVRIPSPDPYLATMVLDGGASGVIAPYVESADQVLQLVGAVKYKPLKGKRLQDFLQGNRDIEPELKDYLDQQNAHNVLIVNIESTPALNALDDILRVDGLDAILVGPHDLSCSLGIPEQYHHPLFGETIDTIIHKARIAGIGVGIHVWDEVGFDQEIEWVKRGANLVMHSNDLSLLSTALTTGLSRIRVAMGEKVTAKSGEKHVV